MIELEKMEGNYYLLLMAQKKKKKVLQNKQNSLIPSW